MSSTRWNRGFNALVVAGLAAAAIALPGSPAATAAKIPAPVLKLEIVQRSITVDNTKGQVSFDPGVWVAALGSPLEFDVQRASYAMKVALTQVIHPPFGGVIRRPLPSRLLAGWSGLARFVGLTIRNSAGTVVYSKHFALCPNSSNPARVSPGGPLTTPYPTQCGTNPFTRALVWGVQRGWAVEPVQLVMSDLPLGVYQMTEAISPVYTRLLHISAADATATVKVTVVNGAACCPAPGCCPQHTRSAGSGRRPTALPALTNPPRAALPDLVALPAWNITFSRQGTQDYLDFGATVWIGGNSQLDVEGFRVPGTQVMRAYQYFWRNGHVIGRARAGTMGFAGYNHWHFQQFARYALVNSAKSLVLRSHKEGFCIGPTDQIDLLLPHAVWQPSPVGLSDACGSPTALWVSEELPLGWGDTYAQSVPGESFNITKVPNGTYYIEVIANPERLLYETTARNDISYRKVILGGTPGHRTVKVPAWHGIDPEP
jgi:hypothetical protein